ncbi:hypothetical protein KAU11_09530 [Candidatus Babeliales bacterium]|nr:hypothetical protein [Candidatus Babeliales bacterium]
MSYRYGREDVQFVIPLIKAGIKLKDVNDAYNSWRRDRGTATEKGDYTNFISKLSPQSKHLDKTVTSAYDHTDKYSVIRNIMYCLGCNEKAAKKVYKDRVLPLCVARFHDPSSASLVSIRYHPASCNDYLYFIFTTEDYAETFGLDPELHTDDVWTVRTEREFREILDGSLTRDDINKLLLEYARNEYVPELVNVCILKQ